MIYVYDTNTFSDLFKSFYRSRFPSLWERFDEMIEGERITSTREVKREIVIGPVAPLVEWTKDHGDVFTTPNADEALFIRDIYAVRHFQQNIEERKILKGGLNADTFIIAKAASIQGTVVTLEKAKKNGVRVPNICEHFKVPCMNLEEFMEAEDWSF